MTSYDYYQEQDDIMHYGILGMKWGVRRFQNPDGTLTELGLKRAARENKLASKIKGAIVSSVVPQLCEIFKNSIKKYLDIEPISLSYKSKMPIKLALKNNKEIFIGIGLQY